MRFSMNIDITSHEGSNVITQEENMINFSKSIPEVVNFDPFSDVINPNLAYNGTKFTNLQQIDLEAPKYPPRVILGWRIQK